MNKTESRKIAISAARGQARHSNIDPKILSADDALTVLDDLYRMTPELIASLWYGEASDNQIKAFKREWEAWRKS